MALTSDLRERFEQLLTSWEIRAAQRKVVVPWIDAQNTNPLLLEQEYGDGNLEDRRQLLMDTLDYLDREHGDKVDFQRIFDALLTARRAACAHWGRASKIDYRRHFQEEGEKSRRNLVRWAKDYRRHLRETGRGSLPIAKRLDRLIEDLRPIPPVSDQPLRRARAGRQRQPWLSVARKELRAAGVTAKEDRELLLEAAFLKPPPHRT